MTLAALQIPALLPAFTGLWCVAALLVTAALGVLIGGRSWSFAPIYGACLLISLVGFAAAFSHLWLGAAPETVSLPIGLPGVGSRFRLDSLAAFFLLVVNLGGGLASLYALGYGRHETSPLRVLPFYPAYLAGMNMVALADDAVSFLIAWEFMSLSSWALVVSNHRAPENVRAGFVYLLMASIGTLTLVLAFGVLAGVTGDYSFAAMRAHHLDAFAAGLVFLLALLGAGSKAGLVPLHIWLPLAHPAAPSHVSALMSGVMTKIAIYGFIRIAFDLAGTPAWWWGLIVLAIGGATAVLGVLYAVMQQDVKRLLAYSTVENVGIVFIGLGLGLAFRASDMPVLSALGVTAALLHVFNHSLFKSLLFFGAGALVEATGERNMEKLGGLIHRLPRTAVVFLVGCVATAGLPPLNGFVSEWLTFQAILVGPELPQWGLRFIVPAVGAMLALAAAVAAACFVKAYGIVFLGRPRSPAAGAAHETDAFSLAAMFILAGLCFLAGVLPGPVIDFIAPVVQGLAGESLPVQLGQAWMQNWASLVPIASGRSSYNGLLIFGFLAASGVLTALAVHRFATRVTRRSDIWDCGYPDPTPAAQYSSSSFAMPIRRVFGVTVFQVRETVDMPRPGETRPGHFRVRVIDPAWHWLYGPVVRTVGRVSAALNGLQFLSIRRYLSLVFVTLVLLLMVVAAWR
ncbi:hydrogenase 4 subunit B [Rhodoplanes sp. Z2-YC6860]|uniref:hydrogenase 4 subunit B n=1 Tax=Rhodoplanes sp. Z2-YC6860 TaxID=674703 RepID=UPI00078C1ED2|nr:hydrogenase 4 subunit B [Rhodoplanes sp. Z2-YC6860]AMN41278.1 hydrogenase 4 subunit B [Rhodoplanes sp. Z2-YC6860]